MLFLNIFSIFLYLLNNFNSKAVSDFKVVNVKSAKKVIILKTKPDPNKYIWKGNLVDFQNPNSWAPSRTSLKDNDILIFNSSTPATCIINNIPNQTIGQIIIQDNREVLFEGAISPTTISISGNDGDDLYLGAGCKLTYSSDNAIQINLLPGTTGNINGEFNMSSVLGGNPLHRLLAADINSITFNSGSSFIANNLTGNSFGDINNNLFTTIIFKSGSKYINKSGANPFALAQPLSKVKFDKGSLYSHQQISGLSFAGRTYGDFEFDIGKNINLDNYFGSNLVAAKIYNFRIKSGNLKFSLSTNKEGANINIIGNLIVEKDASLNFNPLQIESTSIVTFNGNSTQIFSGEGLSYFGPNVLIVIDNNFTGGEALLLEKDLIVNNSLILKNGVIKTNGNKVFPMFISGGSAASHINGNLKLSLPAGLKQYFPLGDGTHYQKVEITPNCTGDYSAKYNAVNPNSTPLTPFTENNVDFNEILNEGYWQISSALCSFADYEIHLFPTGFSNFPTERAAYTIAKRDGNGNWLKDGSIFNLDNTLNFVQNDLSLKRQNMKGFSDFSIVTNAIIPLPIVFENFHIEKMNEKLILKWKAKDNDRNGLGFSIEKSIDGKQFSEIQFINYSKDNSINYSYEDNKPVSKNYYRIKYINKNDEITYSKIIFSELNSDFENEFTIYPNPINNQIEIQFPYNSIAAARLFNSSGTLILKTESKPELIKFQLQEKLNSINSGLYIVELIQNQKIYYLKIIKNE